MMLEPFRLERYFAQYEFKARYLLCSSDCETMSVDELLSLEPEARYRLSSLRLGYTEPPGSPSLRRAIASTYSALDPEEVVVHSGAEEAIFLFMHSVLRPGDELVVHSPCYQSLEEVARGIGCEVTRWNARPGDWSLDLEELEDLIGPRTKAVVVNTPHNPTGHLMPRSDFKDLCQIVDDQGAVLLSDEVYRGSEHDASDRLPAACEVSESAVSLGVMSKTYGLAGLRIGWVATRNRAVREAMERLKDYTTICNSAPSELLAEVALHHHETIAGRNLGIIKDNLRLLDRFFEARRDQFEWSRPKAGPIAYPRWTVGDVDGFCQDLVESAGVLLLPGSVYGDRTGRFRIGFGRRNMPEALETLNAYIDVQGKPISPREGMGGHGP
jgi:aspartate/methionine/tyrosine aminotransferase